MNWLSEHKKSIAFILFLATLFSLSFLATYAFYTNLMVDAMSKHSEYLQESSLVNERKDTPDGIYTFLLLGVDERSKDDDVGRSDSTVLVFVNFKENRIGLLSLPRDSRVEVGRHGLTKLNHAYAYGGELLVRQTIESLTNISIDYYVTINFKAFYNIVNAIGGVDLFVDRDMYYRDDYDGESGLLIDIKKGTQHLDGEKALQYVRFRDDEGDIGRVRRQQYFLQEAAKKLSSPKIIIEIPNIVREISSAVSTDISFGDMLCFVRNLSQMQKPETLVLMADGKAEMIDDISYWTVNPAVIKEQASQVEDFVAGRYMAEKPKAKENKPEVVAEAKTLEKKIAEMDGEVKERQSRIREQLLREEAEERETVRRQREYEQVLKQEPKVQSEDGVVVINTTGDESKTKEAILQLRDAGFEVGMVSLRGNGSPNSKTLFIVGRSDMETIAALKELSFKYTTLYRTYQTRPTLIIGEDF